MSLAIAATVFAVIFPAELPDKTALASLLLGSRYRPVWAFTGIAAAFAVHVGLAVAAGSLLALLPHRPVEIVVAVLFTLGAVLLLRGRHGGGGDEHVEVHGQPGFWRVSWTGFAVVLVAEFGDLTQLATASLAARFNDPLSVAIGAVLALWAVAALAIAGGRGLLKILPLTWITRIAAAIMLVLAGISLAAALV
ncbi:MAG: TMEM165/GDT1 family protein [Actinobacteria bacterium]|nr:TMEM165/GDT1 family protein [Actinomycetota bacterium]